MTKRWSSTVSDLTKTKRQASKEGRRPIMCEECGKYPADPPSSLCPGCERSLENPFAAEREIERLRAVNADMLAALKLVDEFGDGDRRAGDDALWTDQFRTMFEAARAAIAKAEGRS